MISEPINEKMTGAYLRGHMLFNYLDEDALKEICSVTTLIKLKKRSLFLINDSRPSRVYFIVNGTAKLTNMNNEGANFVKDILVDGDVFGDLSLKGWNSGGYVVALRPNTYIISLITSEFRKILHRHPRLATSYAEAIGDKFQQLEARHYIWTNYDARQRLLYFLRGWSSCAGTRNENMITLENYFALSDISDFIGVSRQFMHIMLKELKEEGLVYYSRRKIIVAETFLQHQQEKHKEAV